MKHFKILSFLLISSFTCASQPEILQVFQQNGDQKIVAEKMNGMLNGKFTSWYENGQKKAEGSFLNNQRNGIWTIWDSNGVKRVERNYENNFTIQKESLFDLNSKPINSTRLDYKLSRNAEGFFEYQMIYEKDIAILRRIWRVIHNEAENSSIFKSNALFEAIHKNRVSGQFSIYSPENDEFRILFDSMEVEKTFNKNNLEMVGFKIKEEWIFAKIHQLSETRIVGICPIIISDENTTPTDLCWIYYPDLRSVLAQHKLHIPEDTLIQNLEDIFMFRHFSSSIYKESNVRDREISDYKTGKEAIEEFIRIELEFVDREHNYWIRNE